MSSRARTRTAAVLLAVPLLAALAGCATVAAISSSGVATGAAVTVTVVPAPGAAGLYIADDDGLFTQAGLHVTIASTVSASDTVTALTAGRTDVVLGQWTTAIAAEARGIRLRAIEAGNSGGPGLEELVTLPDSPVSELSQLPGTTIAVNALDGLPQALTETLLDNDGIPASKVRFVAVPFPEMAARLLARQVSAAFLVEPYLSEAEMKYGVTKLADLDQGATENFPVTGYFTTQQWAASHPAVATAFITALREGQEIAATDRPAVEQALIRHLGISPMAAAVMSPGTYPTGPVDPADLERVGDLMQADGLLSREADVYVVARSLTS